MVTLLLMLILNETKQKNQLHKLIDSIIVIGEISMLYRIFTPQLKTT